MPNNGSRKAKHAYYLRQKTSAFALLGNACKRCGFKDIRALQIDHVHGDGYKDRKKGNVRQGAGNTVGIYLTIVKGQANGRYQLLCANCNWIKRCENNEIPKIREEY